MDTNWAGDLSDGQSTIGFVFKMGTSPITLMKNLQLTDQLSTEESSNQKMPKLDSNPQSVHNSPMTSIPNHPDSRFPQNSEQNLPKNDALKSQHHL